MAYISKKTTVNGVKPIGSNLFGTCSTASATAQKDVTMADFDVLVSGVTIHVYFTHKNTASNPTLKVGSTSAVAIKCNGATEGNWDDGAVISFTYNGSNWIQNDAIGGDGETYTLSKNGNTITLTDSQGQSSSVTVDEQRYPYVDNVDYNDSLYMAFSVSKTPNQTTGNNYEVTVKGVGKIERVNDDLVVHNYEPTGHSTSSETVQTIPLGTTDGDTTYELERNLLTVTHSLYVDLDGIGYDPSEDNYVTSNDGYEYLGHGTANTVYIVDASGNDISNISNVNLANVPYADYYSFGQALHDYFATHNAYRLKINDELTQSIRNVSSRIQEGAIPPYDIHEAQAWYQDADIFEVVAIGVVVGSHDTIDLVGSDNTTTSVALKAIDIGALPASKWHANDRNHDGYVQGTGGLYPNSAWATDSNGDPSWRRLVDIFYPVGSYYMTTDASFNPNTVWGGTWVRETGETYTASWTATSTNANGARVTNSLTLDAGTYLITIKTPVLSHDNCYFGLNSFSLVTSSKYSSQDVRNQVLVLTQRTTFYVATDMSLATNYSYIERGYLKARRMIPEGAYSWHRTA